MAINNDGSFVRALTHVMNQPPKKSRIPDRQVGVDPYQDPGGPLVVPTDTTEVRRPGEYSDEELIKSLQQTYDYEYARRQPHVAVWDRTWDRMNNIWEMAKKRDWQSKRGLPALTILGLKLTWEITKQLETAGDKWFELEAVNPSWQPLMDIERDFMIKLMGSADRPENNFFSNFYDAVLGALICENATFLIAAENDDVIDMVPDMEEAFSSGAPPTDPATGEGFAIPSFGFGSPGGGLPSQDAPVLPGQKGFTMRVEAMNPRYIFKDSAGRRKLRYMLWYQEMTAGEFRAEGEARGWEFIDEAIKDSVASGAGMQERTRDLQDKQLARDKRTDRVVLIHFFGMLPHPDTGEVMLKNHYMVIAQGKYLIQKPVENPYWHKQIPIVSAGLLRFPWSVYNKSLLGLSLDAQESRVEILNLLLDYLKQTIVPPNEVDLDQFAQSRGNQLQNGIYPGMTLYLEKGGKAAPAVARSGQPDTGSGVWQAIGFLEQKYSEFTGTDQVSAMPRTRNRITASEAKERMAAAGGLMDQIYRNIEHTLLEPMLYQFHLVALQKVPQKVWSDFIQERIDALTPPDPVEGGVDNSAGTPPKPGQPVGNPKLVEKLKEMQKWGPRDRFVKLGAAFRPKVRVYSAQYSRRENLEKLDMVAQASRAVPQLGARLRWSRVAEEWVRNLELDPAKYLWPDDGPTADQPMPMIAASPEQVNPMETGPGGTPMPPGGVTPPPGLR